MGGLGASTLFLGDNLDWLRQLPAGLTDLIYLDPPFNSGRGYRHRPRTAEATTAAVPAFNDKWAWDSAGAAALLEGQTDSAQAQLLTALRACFGETPRLAYLVMLAARLPELHRILAPAGSLYLHCDPTTGHYVKLLLDCVFGPERFLNELVWRYRTGGGRERRFARKHDTLFLYSKTASYTFNPLKEQAYTKSRSRKPGIIDYGGGAAEFFEDEQGVYNLVNMTDVWDIPYINSQAKERLGYPTQKPLALLERIVAASSNPGDLVLDPFCGSGTTLEAAQRLGRRWIGIDSSPVAIGIAQARLIAAGAEVNIR